MPQNDFSWFVLPTGRTSWVCISNLIRKPFDSLYKGLDWHGYSAREAFYSVDALASILGSQQAWDPWNISPEKVLLIGHSNGGQGAWHVAERFPDRVIGGKSKSTLR